MYIHSLDAYALFWWSFYKLFSWLIIPYPIIHVTQLEQIMKLRRKH